MTRSLADNGSAHTIARTRGYEVMLAAETLLVGLGLLVAVALILLFVFVSNAGGNDDAR